MMRGVWLGSATRQSLFPSLPLYQFPAPPCRVQCCAAVDAKKLVDLEYAELELNDIQVGGVRVRQHANPFRATFTTPIVPPTWETEFADPTLPLHVDIGCASGRLLMLLAKRNVGSCNYLGIDIREKLLQRSTKWAQELGLTNIHYMVANATLSLDAILMKYPGPLRLISILCPDPHFKQKHRKRRIVQKTLLEALEKHLPPDGQVFVQSDIEEVAEDMRDQFDENVKFTRVHPCGSDMCDSEGWLLESPLGIATEREIHAVANGGRIFRQLFQHV
ncbi:uncharacterized protein [Physcomitrium patens]|uniref:tRNA (guanine(46)-N(7))-methyltransferase n=1 Tax=Physcomitrium patens TaxID=3218 RepID=A0A2K1IXJ6_PHYPA|nr:uncharacterized protein LOC112295792 [Physcomitrium patens]PNR34002.1 hypothetical protein PHYPA_023818 [Physcomitrium patens]|eukprot:XP_024403508.1 uncharacterized protein LOC112295792 [Physcomitrella patens]